MTVLELSCVTRASCWKLLLGHRNGLTLPLGTILALGTDISGHEVHSVSLRELECMPQVLEGVRVLEAWLFYTPQL